MFHSDKCVGLLSYKLAAAHEILHTIREMYMNLPKSLRFAKKIWNKDCIQFANNSRIIIGNCNPNSVKGRSLDLIVVDEAAHISETDFKNFMMSVFPTQASRPDSQMIFITTPKKKDSEFYRLYEHAIARGNECSFNVTHLKWNCIAKRDTKWKRTMQEYYDAPMFKTEFLAEFV